MSKFKKILSFMLVTLCLVTIGLSPIYQSQALSVCGERYCENSATVSSTKTKRASMYAYKRFLAKNSYVYGSEGKKLYYFCTFDINKDGIKELLMVDKTERFVTAYTYTKGIVKYCGTFYDRGIVFIDKSGRLARRFNNSGEYDYYYLTLNRFKQLYLVSYGYDKIEHYYYKATALADNKTPWERVTISKAEYKAAAKKAAFSRNITKHKNTSSNRSKYLR